MDLKEKLVNKYKELLKHENIDEVKAEIEEVTKAFKSHVVEDRKTKLEAFVADGDKAEFFEMPTDEFDRQFEELNAKHNAILKDRRDRKKREEEKNFEVKTDLLNQLTDIINNEDVIAEAFKRFNTIQERWEAAGNVPSEKFKDLQNEFRRKIEEFYYHINIYKELKINDLKKNLEKKEDLIKRMETLREEENIKEIEVLHKAYLMEWDQIGPTFKENWEEIKARFYDLSHQLSDRVKEHYKGIREDQKKNLEKKRELIESIREIAKQEFHSSTDWTKATEKIKEIQTEWKNIGFATKSQNQKVWEEFRAVANDFFERKSGFFKDVKGVQKKVKEVKNDLIEKARELTNLDNVDDHFNWKQRTQEIINLQKQWKAAGSAARHDEQKLWKKFRAYSDEYFQKKDAFFSGKDSRLKENLTQKEALIKTIKAWKPSGEKDADLKALEAFGSQWSEIGFVPGKAKDKVARDFASTLDAAYGKLDVSKDDRVELAFKGRLNQLLSQDDALQALQGERRRLNDRKAKVYEEQLQYENNLQFFSSSNSDNPLLKEAKAKIEGSKGVIQEIEHKIKLVNIEINRLKKEEAGDSPA